MRLQQAMRVFLLFTDARNEILKRSKKDDAKLVRVLEALPPQNSTGIECMFCGALPECDAITLSKCGQCSQAAYCSRGCQKAHWKIHKKVCEKK